MARVGAIVASLSVCVGVALGASTATAAYPGANGKIAFTASGIRTISPDGSRQTGLTRNGLDQLPSWSPDGTTIAFASSRDDNYDIYTTSGDGSGRTNLTSDPARDAFPTWSPGGERIAFASDRDGDWEIYVMNADGSGQVPITSDAGTDVHPAWSPDGTRIAFASDRAGNNFDIYSMRADGGDARRLTTTLAPFPLARGNFHPAWSPDGTRIAFASDRDRSPAINVDVYVMNVDGSGQTRLTDDPAFDQTPAWSPDGSAIAFASSRDGGWLNVYTMKPDGSSQTRLTNEVRSHAHDPDWQPLVPGPRCKYFELGSAGADTLRGSAFSDQLSGRGGDDHLIGADGPDCLDGGKGRDRLEGGRGDDRLDGGAGGDRLRGGPGNDVLSGRGQRDSYDGGGGDDRIDSADGRRETVRCGPGRDTVKADARDRLVGCENVRRV